MKEFLDVVRSFTAKDPDIFWQVKDDPRRLRVGLEAITNGDGAHHFTIGMGKTVDKDKNELSSEDHKILSDYYSAKVAFDEAEKKYIEMLTGTHKKELEIRPEDLRETLDKLVEYAGTLK